MPINPSAVVYTWGTQHGASAYGHGIKSIITGGNVGHASIAVRFSKDQRGDELIKLYCDSPNDIPYSIKEVPGGKEKCYEVYFSYWPGTGNYVSVHLPPPKR